MNEQYLAAAATESSPDWRFHYIQAAYIRSLNSKQNANPAWQFNIIIATQTAPPISLRRDPIVIQCVSPLCVVERVKGSLFRGRTRGILQLRSRSQEHL